MKTFRMAAALAAALACIAGPGAAVEPNPLVGSTIDFVVTGSPGDGYDLAARLFARYLEIELGEGTEVVVRNSVEGGGRLALKSLFAGAPDGLHIAMVHSGVLADQLLADENAEFDFAAASWIGKLSDTSRILVSGPAAPYTDMAGLLAATGPQTLSGHRATSFSTIEAYLLNAMLGLHLQPVLGYDGSTKLMAVLKGEVRLSSGTATTLQSLLDSPGTHVLLFTSRGHDAASFGEAPSLTEMAAPKDRPLVDFIDATARLGRVVLAPPGLSPEMTAAWQDAFQRVTSNKDFLAEAVTLQLEVAPLAGPEVTAMVSTMYADEAGLRSKIKAAVACGRARAEGREDGC